VVEEEAVDPNAETYPEDDVEEINVYARVRAREE
jgi:hypothetical protein